MAASKRYSRTMKKRNARSKLMKRNVNRNRNLYRTKVPRTLQLATHRPTRATLKFVKNMTFMIKPGGTGGTGTRANTAFSIRANSIDDLFGQAGGTVINGYANNAINAGWVTGQDISYSPGAVIPTVPVQADGYENWTQRFQHYVVSGSKISVTYEPISASDQVSQEPATLYCCLNGSENKINHTTEMDDIVKFPYLKRSQILVGNTKAGPGAQSIGQGGRVDNFYSARRFQNVKDPLDNSNLRGRFDSAPGTYDGAPPSEASYFYFGLCNTMPNQSLNAPNGIMRVKVEYITKLIEPTSTNQISMGSGQAPLIPFYP